MNDSTLGDVAVPSVGAAPARVAPASAGQAMRGGALAGALLYLGIAALVIGAWRISRAGWFEAGDVVGYRLGLAGGLMMLLLFSYPLRKYVRALHRFGKVKWWFAVHMVLGVGGPLLLLLHSTFRVGSTNAAVALYSMLVVAGSGVIGRFLYLQVHRGLSGEKASLTQLRARAGLAADESHSRLQFAPEVEAWLITFADTELAASPGWRTGLRQVFWLPLQRWRLQARCNRGLHAALREQARRGGWAPVDRQRRERLARKLVRRHLASVVRVAQFSAYERLFALWHVAHVPFVYLMVVSAVVHVIAVHAY